MQNINGITLAVKLRLVALFLLLSLSEIAKCTVWQVGPTRTYSLPSAVAGLVSAGDTVQIDSATYTDCAVWTKSHLLLQGPVNGYAHCINSVCGYKGIWVINAGADSITIENMEFSGASISGSEGGNGAGLRAQGGSYTIRHCYFHNNQNGILCNPTAGNDSADVLIENSIFAYNGCPTGDPSGCNPGYEHNMYTGSGYRSFTLLGSYSHGAIVGHNVKTRANNNYILYNRIMDEGDGTSSYDIDIAQGGSTIIMGNLIEGGPHKSNHSIICYNEGSTNAPPQNLYLINNTIVNDQTTGYFLFMPLSTNDTLTMLNNIIAGPGVLFNGNPGFGVIDSGNNLISTSIAAVNLEDAAAYNYNLTDSSPAINSGASAGWVFDIKPISPFSLTPVMQYVDSANTEARSISGGIIDIGAYEYPQPTAISSVASPNLNVRILQNPSTSQTTIEVINPDANNVATILVYDATARLITAQCTNRLVLNNTNIANGTYMANVRLGSISIAKKFVVTK